MCFLVNQSECCHPPDIPPALIHHRAASPACRMLLLLLLLLLSQPLTGATTTRVAEFSEHCMIFCDVLASAHALLYYLPYGAILYYTTCICIIIIFSPPRAGLP
jgi:hypothetical protein